MRFRNLLVISLLGSLLVAANSLPLRAEVLKIVVDDTIQAATAERIELGGVDLQILGVGTDGHIGFNEPGSSLASRTRIKTLIEQTRKDNARFFDSIDDVPHHVVTQGLGTIMDARHVVLVATGAQKAQAVRDFVEGPVAAICAASVLQLHPHATILIDEAAASSLRLADYYRHAFESKPEWQGL